MSLRGGFCRLLQCAALALVFGGVHAGAPGKTMTPDEILRQLTAWPDAEFHAMAPERLEAVELGLARLPFSGMALGAPKAIAMNEHGQVPVVLLRKLTTQREWEVNPRLNTQIVVVDPDRGEVVARSIHHAGKRRMVAAAEWSRSGKPPDADEADDTSASALSLDLVQLFGLAPRAARLTVRAIYFDWQSNPVEVQLRMPASTAPAPVRQPVKVEGFRVPERVGVNDPVPVQGSMALTSSGPGIGLRAVHLLVTQLDRTRPWVVDIGALAAADRAESVPFSFDLRQHIELGEGTYRLYVVAAGHFGGPFPLIVGSGVRPRDSTD